MGRPAAAKCCFINGLSRAASADATECAASPSAAGLENAETPQALGQVTSGVRLDLQRVIIHGHSVVGSVMKFFAFWRKSAKHSVDRGLLCLPAK
jgi:hypothetical protein